MNRVTQDKINHRVARRSYIRVDKRLIVGAGLKPALGKLQTCPLYVVPRSTRSLRSYVNSRGAVAGVKKYGTYQILRSLVRPDRGGMHGCQTLCRSRAGAPETFAAETVRIRPDLIGISCLLTSALPERKTAIQILHTEPPPPRPPVIIGGTCVDEQISRYVQADYWVGDGAQGLKVCRQVIRNNGSANQALRQS